MGMEEPNVQRRADLHQQGAQVSQAHSGVGQAQAKIDQIDAQIRDSRSIAPFDGVITRKLVETGDTVQPGTPMIEFADLKVLQIKADIPARLIHGLKKGDVVSARLDSSTELTRARVARIFPVANEERHTITVKFDLPLDVQAAPGMYADVLTPDKTQSSQASVILIPRKALSWRGSMPGVQVVGEDGKTQLRLLRVKAGSDEDWVQVYAGLKPGERILVP